MPLHQAAHHLCFARRAERRSGLLGFFHRDQPIDDLAAFDQQRMHVRVDAIDFAIVCVLALGGLIGVIKPESKENIDSPAKGPIYAVLTSPRLLSASDPALFGKQKWPISAQHSTLPTARAKRTTPIRRSCALAWTSRCGSTPASIWRRCRSPIKPTARSMPRAATLF